MKTLKKVLALALCAVSATSMFAACEGREEGVEVDAGKTKG